MDTIYVIMCEENDTGEEWYVRAYKESKEAHEFCDYLNENCSSFVRYAVTPRELY